MWTPSTVRRLAKLGDALINFIVSAALTLCKGSPQGIRVTNRVLRDVAESRGLRRRGEAYPEDLFEALVGYAWIKGIDTEKMVEIVRKAMNNECDVEPGLLALLDFLLETEWGKEAMEKWRRKGKQQ